MGGRIKAIWVFRKCGFGEEIWKWWIGFWGIRVWWILVEERRRRNGLCVLEFLLRKEMKLHRSDSASKQWPPFDSITFKIGRFEMKGSVLGLGQW
jgi:hypothetical protein